MRRCGARATPAAVLLLLQILISDVGAVLQSTLSDDVAGDVSYADESHVPGLMPLPLLAAAASLNKVKAPADTVREYLRTQAEDGGKDILTPFRGNFFDEKRVIFDDRNDRRELNVLTDFLGNNPFFQAALSGFDDAIRVQKDLTYAQLLNPGSRRFQNRQAAFQFSNQGNARPSLLGDGQVGSQQVTKKDEYELPRPENGKSYDGRIRYVKDTDVEEPRSKIDPSTTMHGFTSDDTAKIPRKKWLLRRSWKGVKRSKSADILHSSYKRQLNLGNRNC